MTSRYYLSFKAKGVSKEEVQRAADLALLVAGELEPVPHLEVSSHAHGLVVSCGGIQFGFAAPEAIEQLPAEDRKRFLNGESGLLDGLTPNGNGEGIVRTGGELHDAVFRALLVRLSQIGGTRFSVQCSLEVPTNEMWSRQEVLKDFKWWPQLGRLEPVLARTGMLGAAVQVKMLLQERPSGGGMASGVLSY